MVYLNNHVELIVYYLMLQMQEYLMQMYVLYFDLMLNLDVVDNNEEYFQVKEFTSQ